jgi:hypothetical protein
MEHIVTRFSNILNTSTPFYGPVSDILERIKNGNSKEVVERIRKEKDKEKRNQIKKELPAICFSGEFSKRADNALVQHSGLICLDFDGFNTVKDMLSAKKQMASDEYIMSVFISPSGIGLKVLVKIPADPENHRGYFKSLEEYFGMEEFDKSCKNESRVCYESYDPKIYINYDSEVWNDISEEKAKEVDIFSGPKTVIIDDHNEIIRRLMIWWEKDHGFVDGMRNNNLFVLASAMNQYGVPKSTVSFAFNQFVRKDFPSSEIQKIIDQGYLNQAEFGRKAFEDVDKVDSIRRDLKQGTPIKEVKDKLLDEGLDKRVVETVVAQADKTAHESVQVFWKKSDKGAVSITHHLFKEFLVDNGFYKYYPEGSNNFIFVRRVSNRVINITDQNIKDYVLGYLERKVEDMSIWNFFADRTRFFKEDFLSLLPEIDINFINDTSEDSYLFFNNVAVKVEKDKISQIEYENLPGWVWEDQMIPRDFNVCDGVECDFKKFIQNVAGDEKERVSSIESTIGFLMHGYKDPGYCPAVIINDENISDNPEGGTGKGIFITAISHLKKSVEIDGKSFTFDKSFPYQTVQQDTQILVFDDVRASFDFERLFSVITQGITLEKKNKDAIRIPFKKSPKISITTNYAIRGSGNSFDRRKWELEFKQFYNKDYTPQDEFGRRLFDDWEDDEWCQFDNYMVGNLQKFLKEGFVKSEFKNLPTRRFISETSHEFYEWIEDTENNYGRVGVKHIKKTLYNEFVEYYPDYGPRGKINLTRKKFYAWLDLFAEFKYGTSAESGRESAGAWIRFKHKQYKQSKANLK